MKEIFSTGYIIIIMKPIKEHILDYLNELKDELHRNGIVLLVHFGSYARGENTLYSDIDIAIKKEENYLQHLNAYTYFKRLRRSNDESLKSSIVAVIFSIWTVLQV